MARVLKPVLTAALEDLYFQHNRRVYVHPDPMEFLYRYDDPRDQEIAGLIAAGLAYGRVAQILKSVDSILAPMGPSPRVFVETTNAGRVTELFRGFKHRWTTGGELIAVLLQMQCVLREFGSFEAGFLRHYDVRHDTVLSALDGFVGILMPPGHDTSSLLSAPSRGSACKRMLLYLRWMVRKDEVDPGCWTSVDPAKLVMPVDTHIHRLSRVLGLTKRNQADLRTALEITRRFKRIVPNDPLKYDFSLTRLGIHPDLTDESFLATCRGRTAA